MLAWLACAVLTAQEPPAGHPAPAEPASSPFICLNRLEISLRAGLVAFSSDFESDPQPSASLHVRAALPWLSHDLLGFCERHVGVFAELTASSIDRDLPLDDPDGAVFFLSGGLDVELARTNDVSAHLQAGLQAARFGDVDATDDGLGALIGLRTDVRLLGDLWLTASPQAAFGDDDERIYFLHVGLRLGF